MYVSSIIKLIKKKKTEQQKYMQVIEERACKYVYHDKFFSWQV